MSQLMQANRQWSTRPADERFTSLLDLNDAVHNFRSHSQGKVLPSLWDVSTGVTAYARGISYQDERVKLERAAGKVLDLAIK